MRGWLARLFGPSYASIDGQLKIGQRGELAAEIFLRRCGYQILQRNLRLPQGEIDIIAVDRKTIVFVEVKTWFAESREDPSEAVDDKKQARIARAALVYLKQHRLLSLNARFDVVSIIWGNSKEPSQIRHFKSAFDSPGIGQFFG